MVSARREVSGATTPLALVWAGASLFLVITESPLRTQTRQRECGESRLYNIFSDGRVSSGRQTVRLEPVRMPHIDPPILGEDAKLYTTGVKHFLKILLAISALSPFRLKIMIIRLNTFGL